MSKALHDADVFVVREAIAALSAVGSSAVEAIPSLQKLAKHEDKQIAERSKAAIRQITGK